MTRICSAQTDLFIWYGCWCNHYRIIVKVADKLTNSKLDCAMPEREKKLVICKWHQKMTEKRGHHTVTIIIVKLKRNSANESTVCAQYWMTNDFDLYACRHHKNGIQAARNDLMVHCATFLNLMVLFQY